MDLFVQKCCFLLHNMLIYGLELCGLLVDYCDVFISCLTLILMAPIHCRGSIDTFPQVSNSCTSYILHNFSQILFLVELFL